MADKAQNAPRRPVLIEYLDAEKGEGDLSEEEIIFNKFKEELSTGENYATITVYRQPGAMGRASKNKLVYLFECGIDEYSFPQLLARLRDFYGTGTYRLQGRNADRNLIFNRSVEVETVSPMAGGDPNNRKDSTTDIMRAVQEMMAANQARTDALISQLTQKTDPVETVTKWAALLTPFVPMFTAMVSRTPPPAAATASFLDELAKFGKIKEIVADLGGGGGDGGGAESNFYDLAGKALETLGPVVGMAIQKGALQLPAPAAGTPGAAARPMPEAQRKPSPTNATPKTGAPEMPRAVVDPIQNQVKLLLMNAKAGQDPIAVAEMVLDNTPDEKLVDLQNFVGAADVLDRMANAVPEVKNHLPWFAALRDNVLRLITEIETDNVAPAESTTANTGSSSEPDIAPIAPSVGT